MADVTYAHVGDTATFLASGCWVLSWLSPGPSSSVRFWPAICSTMPALGFGCGGLGRACGCGCGCDCAAAGICGVCVDAGVDIGGPAIAACFCSAATWFTAVLGVGGDRTGGAELGTDIVGAEGAGPETPGLEETGADGAWTEETGVEEAGAEEAGANDTGADDAVAGATGAEIGAAEEAGADDTGAGAFDGCTGDWFCG